MEKSTKADAHPPYVIIVWDDAWGDATAVVTLKDVEAKHRPTVMQTIGWLLKEDEKGISLANERCLDLGDEGYRGQTFIPRSLVRSVTPFKVSIPRKKKEPVSQP